MNDWKEDTFVDNMNHLLFDFLDKHADMYEGKDAINPELYDLYKVKRGLRDKDGNGVVAGLTTISTIEAFDISGDQKVPCDGRLYYRGYDVRELVSGTVREKRFGFEEAAYLLMFGCLPDRRELKQFCDDANDQKANDQHENGVEHLIQRAGSQSGKKIFQHGKQLLRCNN